MDELTTTTGIVALAALAVALIAAVLGIVALVRIRRLRGSQRVILGAHGVPTVAAAGVLLTATATVGSLSYAAWAVIDRLFTGDLAATPEGGLAGLSEFAG